jgi:NTP pyrophosphatase (non-canonical NTP hydrolase)
MNGCLVLVARAGFIPNGNDHRSHRGTTLLALREAGAGDAGVMAKSGHVLCSDSQNAYRRRHAKQKFFVMVKIARRCSALNDHAMPALTDAATTVSDLKTRVLAFVRERDWEQFHSPKNLSMALAAETGELMEHFLWATAEQSRAIANEPARRAKIADELADVVIYALEFANMTGLDVSAAIEAKMAANAEKYPVEKARGRSEKYTEL